MFFNCGGREESAKFSVCNRSEADFCAKLIKLLVNAYPKESFFGKIGVITFYKHQVRVIKDHLVKVFGKAVLKSIDVNTVDGFQGQEKDIILLSCVRTERLGFITDLRRMNVAFTRAKKSLWVIGNDVALKASAEWNAFVDGAHKRKMYSRMTVKELEAKISKEEVTYDHLLIEGS
jgi:senataxin